MPGHDQTCTQHDKRRGFVDEDAQSVSQHPLKCGPPFFDAGDNAAQSGIGQHDTRRRFGDIGRGRDRYPHLRLPQRGSVISAVAAHPDGVALLLKRLDQSKLVLGENSCIHGEIVGAGTIGDPSRRTDRPLQSNCSRDRRSGGRGITGDHDCAHTQGVQLGEQAARVGPGWVAKGNQPDNRHCSWRTTGNCQNPVSCARERLQFG